jgi:hypothetical protein
MSIKTLNDQILLGTAAARKLAQGLNSNGKMYRPYINDIREEISTDGSIRIMTLKDMLNERRESVECAIKEYGFDSRSTEYFMGMKAIEYELTNRARTYFVMKNSEASLLGSYTIALKSVEMTDKVTMGVIRTLVGISTEARAFPVCWIDCLSINSKFNMGLNVERLLRLAIASSYNICDYVGVRVCMSVISAKDAELATAYEKNDFRCLKKDTASKTMIMFRKL